MLTQTDPSCLLLSLTEPAHPLIYVGAGVGFLFFVLVCCLCLKRCCCKNGCSKKGVSRPAVQYQVGTLFCLYHVLLCFLLTHSCFCHISGSESVLWPNLLSCTCPSILSASEPSHLQGTCNYLRWAVGMFSRKSCRGVSHG